MKYSKPELIQDLPIREIMTTISNKPDSGKLGNIYAIGKALYYPVVASVMHDQKRIGYLIRWRKMLASSKSVDQLLQLMGTDAKLYVGNADGSLWTNMITQVSAPPTIKENTNPVVQFDRSGTDVLASVNRIAYSQWLVSVEFPKSKILQTANSYVYWLLIVGGVLMIICIFFGWLMGRNLSEPLAKLTEAASQIASGNYPSQVLVNRRDEIGKLARVFNAMAVELQNSQKELQKKQIVISCCLKKILCLCGSCQQLHSIFSLQDLTDELQAITPIDIKFDATGSEESEVDDNIKVMIYRIVQEQMNNILKHAAASDVSITIKTNNTSVKFTIEDNGVGFDTNKKSKGIGLRNIDNRVKFHKGNLHIESSSGQGCVIDIEVPLKHHVVLYS